MLSQHHNMVHGGLLGLRILFHIIVSMNLDVELNDYCKAETNASKKLYQTNPILGNMPPNNLKILNHVVHGMYLQVLVGLVIAEYVKLDEYNVLLMLEASTMFPMMVENHVVSFV